MPKNHKYSRLAVISILVVIVILVAVAVTHLFFNNKKTLQQRRKLHAIPKTIWWFWDSPDTVPKVVDLCVQSWKKYNPNYEIVMLTKQNYKNYVSIPLPENREYSVQQLSDLVRLHVLAKYGGIWSDASIFVQAPFDDWLYEGRKEGQDFIGYYIEAFTSNMNYPVLENWFFACTKENEFAAMWRDEFTKGMTQYDKVEDYVDGLKSMGVDSQKIDAIYYLSMHMAAQKVFQIDQFPVNEKMLLRKAEDGPYKYFKATNFQRLESVDAACKDKSLRSTIMKMIGPQRNYVNENLDGKLSNEICHWVDLD